LWSRHDWTSGFTTQQAKIFRQHNHFITR